MYKRALKFITIPAFIFIFTINLSGDFEISNEEHPEMNSIENRVNIANEEHPEMNFIKFLG